METEHCEEKAVSAFCVLLSCLQFPTLVAPSSRLLPSLTVRPVIVMSRRYRRDGRAFLGITNTPKDTPKQRQRCHRWHILLYSRMRRACSIPFVGVDFFCTAPVRCWKIFGKESVSMWLNRFNFPQSLLHTGLLFIGVASTVALHLLHL